MISALHLLWIVPLSGSLGLFFMALFCANKESDRFDDKEAK